MQRAPKLLVAIKSTVDADRKPGRFLLTGSANVMTLPNVSESLAGRVELVVLRPFSQGELIGRRDGFVDAVFGTIPRAGGEASRRLLIERVLRGGFPEAVARTKTARRDAWFDSYVSTILQQDIRDLANIEGLSELPRLLSILAVRSAGLLNAAELSRSSGLPQTTLKRYLALLETIYLVEPLLPWSTKHGKRLVKSPKIHLTDSGLAARLAGVDEARASTDGLYFGPLLETFAVNELRKQAGWSESQARVGYYRTSAGAEVDAVLETNDGRVVGVEVKAAASVGAGDFRGLRSLAEDAGDRFVRGIVLYDGKDTVAFDERFAAVPFAALWS